jgi:mannose-6-phosphate isomerase-like protein (cupin superfamily)
MRWALAAIALAACGTPAAPERVASERSAGEADVAPAPSVVATEAMPQMDLEEAGEEIAPLLGEVIRNNRFEPQVITEVALVPRPSEPARVLLAHLTLRPGDSFRAPSGACQDVLVFVREGELRAVGTGIASPSAPATIYAGDAVRFGPEGDGLVQNLGEMPARTVLALTRGDAPPSLDQPPGQGCDPARDAGDPFVVPLRSASVRSTQEYAAFSGSLRVRILLDEDSAGARHGALSVLDGDPELTIPEHRHEDAAEVLLIEDGSGMMRIGEREVAVRPGMALYVPRGALHDFRSDGTRPLRAIQVHTPSGPEQRFRRAR